MHYSIIIISSNKLTNNFNSNIYHIKEDTFFSNYSIIDNYRINNLRNNSEIFFDYLIIDSKNFFNKYFKEISKDDNNLPITNCYHQTTIDNVFSIGESSSSSKKIQNQLNDIYEFINN